MRMWAHFAIALGLAAADGAAAQVVTPDLTTEISHAALKDAAFAPTTAVVVWQSSEVRLSERAGGPVDSLRINVGSPQRMPGFAPENDRFDVTLVRSWPKAVSFRSEKLAFDIAPHAGFGVGSFGTRAEGGATLTVSKSRGERALEQLRDLGVKDGASFGDQGRWYLFAAASGRAVGLNMLRGEHGWDRAGWSTDATGALVGDAQVGVGFRKGDVQSSFGVIHREVKGRHMIFGQQTRDDTVAAFTFSLKPQH
ncbi:lipid A-modifier LpxR family protein [Phenylobacterium sp.]|uniref:lipid A-modifier LpxR family protein n=1 Tax=Phenylobacterium sp. TaxID=1871053 RepID=UPI0025F306EB|nr:lipid A-modifier LpxR family protein [Phenylobacterium sp.]